MARILRPFPSIVRANAQQKPPGIPRIDWTHPLTRGLVAYCFDFGTGVIDLVSGRIFTTLGSFNYPPLVANNPIGPGPYGQALLYYSAATTSVGLADPLVFPQQTWAAPYSAACGFVSRFADTFSGVPGFFVLGDATGNDAVAFFIPSTGNFGIGVGNGASPFTVATSTLRNKLTVAVTAATGPNAQSSWINGAPQTAGAFNTGFTGTNMHLVMGSSQAAALTNTNLYSVVYFGAIWNNRALTTADAALLYADPYCFLISQEGLGEFPAVNLSNVTISGVAEADGATTAVATSSATAAEVARADGVATASATSSATAAEIARADGVATAAATSSATAKEVAEADGVATASATSTATAKEVAEADGTVTANAVSTATAAEVARADGVATAVATSSATAKEVAEADGLATAVATSSATAKEVAEADGTVTANAISTATARTVAEADGTATAIATSSATAKEVAEADGTATAVATSTATSKQVAEADGVATATAISGQSVTSAVAEADGVSTAVATSSATAAEVAEADGISTAVATSSAAASAVAEADGVATAAAVSSTSAATVKKVVGWPRGRWKHTSEDLEKRIAAQRANTFGRRWFDDFLDAQEAAVARAKQAEGDRQAAALLEAVEAASQELEAAVAEDRRPIDIAPLLWAAANASRVTASIKHSSAVARAIAQAAEEDEEDSIMLLAA